MLGNDQSSDSFTPLNLIDQTDSEGEPIDSAFIDIYGDFEHMVESRRQKHRSILPAGLSAMADTNFEIPTEVPIRLISTDARLSIGESNKKIM